MNERRQNLIVGLFALGGLLVLAALIVLFGDFLSFVGTPTYVVKVHFEKGATAALREDTAVTLSGKKVGQVFEIDFVDGEPTKGIEVKVRIEGRYSLPEGTRAQILTSLMGFGRPALLLQIEKAPPEAHPLPRDGTAIIYGSMVSMLDQVLPSEMQQALQNATDHIGHLAEALTPVARDLHTLLQARTTDQVDRDDSERLAANLSTAVQRLDLTLKNLNAIIGDPSNRENLAASIANLKQVSDNAVTASKGIAELVGDFRGTLGRTDVAIDSFRETFESAGRRFVDLVDSTDRTVRNLERTIQLMNQGSGTVGLLLNDNRLYESLVLTSQRLTQAIDELRDVLVLMRRGELKYRIF